MKRLLKSPAVRRGIGATLAAGLRLVKATNRTVVDPVDAVARYRHLQPFIGAMWHGQHFLVPFLRPRDLPATVMISRSGDGDINAAAAERFGLGTIRASGGRKAHQIAKRGGARGFREALATLERGVAVAMTADVPKGPARRAGDGIVMLAARSGRPILPLAATTSRRLVLASTWDRTTVNLPFGRMAFVYAEPIWIPPDVTEADLPGLRAAVESSLDRANARAAALADGRESPIAAGAPNAVPADALPTRAAGGAPLAFGEPPAASDSAA